MSEKDPHSPVPDPSVWEKVSLGVSAVDPLRPFVNQRVALGPAAGQLRDGEMRAGNEVYRRKPDKNPES